MNNISKGGKGIMDTCELCNQMIEEFDQAKGHSLCRACNEKNYAKIKEYIINHPEATVQEILRETGIKLKYINRWIEEGRIDVKKEE